MKPGHVQQSSVPMSKYRILEPYIPFQESLPVKWQDAHGRIERLPVLFLYAKMDPEMVPENSRSPVGEIGPGI
jgi:hypothetical protein